MEISCIILAGGKSTRLGRDKVLEKLGDKSLLEQVISRTEPLSKEIIVVTAKERTFTHLESREEVKVIFDIFPGQGSLGGIYTGLVRSSSFYNLVFAADMPFINGSLLKYMMGIAEGFDFVLPSVGGFFEPLHAIYSKACIPPIESLLKQGEKTIIELFKYVKVRYLEAEEIDRFDPRHLSFFNINTQAELEVAKKIAGGDSG